MAHLTRSLPSTLSSLLLLLLLPLLSLAQTTSSQPSTSSTSSAAAAPAAPTIYTSSTKYRYQGCYNETVGLPGTAGTRAIGDDGAGGAHEILEGAGGMTALKCLSFCETANNGSAFRYAGVEYARECWCGVHISSLAVKVDDAQCGLPCDGDGGTVCGGASRLTVYMLSAAPAVQALSGAVVMLVAAAAAVNLL